MKNQKSKKKEIQEIILNGQPISPGIAIGSASILADDYIETQKASISKANIRSEIDRFNKAVEETILDLQIVMDQVGSRVTAQRREIFEAHMMILEDQQIISETIETIQKDLINADYAYFTIMRNYQQIVDSSSDSYLRERAIDIRDIKRRVIRKIQGAQRRLPEYLNNAVIVSRELNLFDIKNLAKNDIAGIVLQGGGRTTHIAIMIRSLEIPSIFGVKEVFENIRNGDLVVANGITGEIIIHPSQGTQKRCAKKRNDFLKHRKKYINIAALPSHTLDKKPFEVNANIEFPGDIEAFISHSPSGIGLYRTEYDFMEAGKIPTEEELYDKYKVIAKRIHPNSVTIRTIDLGGDKIAPFIETELEKNPFLGWRAIRICLDMPVLFKKQLRAIIRASAWGKIRLMFPLISTIDEVRRAKAHVEEVMRELRSQNVDFDPAIPVGIMVEVPSAALLADQFAKEVDFFSIGTNDLIQFTLAVDRGNTRVAQYYNFCDPSVLQLIKMTVRAANKNNIPVGMCGEMAGDPLATFLLLGMGITEFSVSPVMLLEIKQILRSLKFSDAQKISKQCLKFNSANEVSEYLRNVMTKYFPRMDEDYFFRRANKR